MQFRTVAVFFLWVGAVAIAGCGQGGQGSVIDAGGRDTGGDSALQRAVDATGDAATLNDYLGSWTVMGTQIQDCGGQTETLTNSGTLQIAVGTTSDLQVTGTCVYPFNLENGAAELMGVQSCVSTDFTLTYQSWTILTTDGQNGILVAAGEETQMTPGETAYTCLITQEGTLTR